MDDNIVIKFQTVDSGYILSGSTYSNDGDVIGNHGDADLWLVKVNNIGIIQYQKCFGGTSTDGEGGLGGIANISSDTLLIAGRTKSNDGDVSGNHGGMDLWLIKEKVLNSSPTAIEDNQPNNNLQHFSQFFNLSPNPATDNPSISISNSDLSNISISIYNSLGIDLKRSDEKELLVHCFVSFSTEEFPSGVYFCTLNNGINKITKYFVVER